MVTILAAVTSIATVCVIILTMKKVWWAPIAGVLHEPLWIAFALVSDGGWPLLLAVGGYTLCYGLAIPKWYRERKA